jgi:hypothetical protein
MTEILPYSEGTAFAVPLRSGGFARGVVARAAPDGRVLFGYFFGPKLESPEDAVMDDLKPENSILSLIFGDLGLINGEWRIVGSFPQWNRDLWPMPDFVRRDPIMKRAWRVRYSDSDPSRLESEEPIAFDTNLPPNTSSGYGAVELKLTRLLQFPGRNT